MYHCRDQHFKRDRRVWEKQRQPCTHHPADQRPKPASFTRRKQDHARGHPQRPQDPKLRVTECRILAQPLSESGPLKQRIHRKQYRHTYQHPRPHARLLDKVPTVMQPLDFGEVMKGPQHGIGKQKSAERQGIRHQGRDQQQPDVQPIYLRSSHGLKLAKVMRIAPPSRRRSIASRPDRRCFRAGARMRPWRVLCKRAPLALRRRA